MSLFSPISLIHSLIQPFIYKYGLRYILCHLDYNPIPLYLAAQIVPALVTGSFFSWPLCLTSPNHFDILKLALYLRVTQDAPAHIQMHISCSTPPVIFPRIPGSF